MLEMFCQLFGSQVLPASRHEEALPDAHAKEFCFVTLPGPELSLFCLLYYSILLILTVPRTV